MGRNCRVFWPSVDTSCASPGRLRRADETEGTWPVNQVCGTKEIRVNSSRWVER